MTNRNDELKCVLDFPQGRMLCMENNGYSSVSDIFGPVYFLPRNGTEAFLVAGKYKELFGRNAICVGECKERGIDTAYSLVYDVANGALTDPRLVKETETGTGTEAVKGELADESVVQNLKAALAQGKITLYDHDDTKPESIYNVAQFPDPDGRLLIQLSNKNELYLGVLGNYEKLDAQLQVQAGGDMYYEMATGEFIELPYGLYGPRPDDTPTFNGEELEYLIDVSDKPAAFGLELPPAVAHLNPFSPQLTAPKPASPPRPAQQPKPRSQP
jgi:hypothetical protein